MIKKLLLLFAFCGLFAVASHAQMSMAMGSRYKLGIGIRAGLASGISVKYFLSEGNAIEGIVEGNWGKIGVTALYEKHLYPFGVDGLCWFFGGGAHIRNYGAGWGNRSNSFFYYGGGDGLAIGVDGIIGMEYKIPDFPMSASLDFKPFYELDIDGSGFVQSGAGLTLRFALD